VSEWLAGPEPVQTAGEVESETCRSRMVFDTGGFGTGLLISDVSNQVGREQREGQSIEHSVVES